jgi:hypothetical protein
MHTADHGFRWRTAVAIATATALRGKAVRSLVGSIVFVLAFLLLAISVINEIGNSSDEIEMNTAISELYPVCGVAAIARTSTFMTQPYQECTTTER